MKKKNKKQKSDGIVLENLTKNFINDVQLPEARCFYAFQVLFFCHKYHFF